MMRDSGSMISVREFCLSVLQRGDLRAKLRSPRTEDGDWLPDIDPGPALMIRSPARDPELAMANGAERLPRLNELREPTARARCLERFANHELMAIELFAWALLAFPDLPSALRRGFLRVLEEEQIHLQLYLDRLSDLGAPFGSAPLGDYFWQQVPALTTSPHGARAFLAAMGLTFEQANLDFSLLYRDAFRAAGDEQSAQVIERVHRDEIGHVRMAAVWLRRLGDSDRSDVELYQEAIPFPLSAARAKARRFDVESRRRAGLSEEMIEFVRQATPYAESLALHAAEGQESVRSAPEAWGAPALGESDRGALELYANVGAEEDSAKKDSGKRTRRIESIGALWLLAIGLAGAPRIVVPGSRRSRARPMVERLHPALREWLNGQREPSSVLDILRVVHQDPRGRGETLPWLSTEDAALWASGEGLRYLAPEPSVVQRVHDKAFAVREGDAWWNDAGSGCVAVLDPSDLSDRDRGTERVEGIVATWPVELRHSFTLKPRIGTSGRGRVWGTHGKLPPSSIRGLAHLADRGGAVLEPWFDRLRDFSVQLLVRNPHEIEPLGSTEQIVARSGLYHGNRGVIRPRRPEGLELESGDAADAQLRRAAVAVARSAAAEGFYGPCGVDSFSYRSAEGDSRIRPVVEFNARMTTGIIALTAVRAALEISGMPNATRWEFRLDGSRTEILGSPADSAHREASRFITVPLLVEGADGPIVRLS